MGQHNRWDAAAWQMVPCEGSGQPPHNAPAGPAAVSALAAVGNARSA